jgi:general secretion pathway protein A
MYQRYFELRELPFELTSDPRYLYCTRGHREALSNLQYGLSDAKAVTVLVGEAGTGKSTLLHAALESERCRAVQCLYINNPALTRAEFLETLARWFGFGADVAASKARLLASLETALRERLQRGITTALVIDEAQSLSLKLLEEVRLLANIETRDRKLLPLVLAGQPELAVRLNEPALRQLKQRVVLRCQLSAFTVEETAAYVASRIRTAGGNAIRLFTREAVMLIHEYSRGIPRSINVICDNALLTGMALDVRPVGREIVASVVRDLDLHGASAVTPIALPAVRPHAAAATEADHLPADHPPAQQARQMVTRAEPSSSEPLAPLLPQRDDGDERPPLQLDDLDAHLTDPVVPSDDAAMTAVQAASRSRFRLFGAIRR